MKLTNQLAMATVLGLSAMLASAQEADSGSTNTMEGGRMSMGGMMEGGMMTNKGMMCPMGRGVGYLLPQLPEGNEQLQLQMQAEILKSLAEITSKYADRVKAQEGS